MLSWIALTANLYVEHYSHSGVKDWGAAQETSRSPRGQCHSCALCAGCFVLKARPKQPGGHSEKGEHLGALLADHSSEFSTSGTKNPFLVDHGSDFVFCYIVVWT